MTAKHLQDSSERGNLTGSPNFSFVTHNDHPFSSLSASHSRDGTKEAEESS